MEEALTFDDVLLLPQYSEVLPSDVCIETRLSSSLSLSIPILSAAMDSVTELPMALAMAQLGGMGVVHKNLSKDAQSLCVQEFRKCTGKEMPIAAAIGIGNPGIERAQALVEAGVQALVIDTAHAHSKSVLQTAIQIKSLFPATTLIAGNIVTGEAAKQLADVGVDAVKVGIGPGSICTTRIVSGVGCPQITAILSVSQALQGSSVALIADGGMRYSGDIVKALAAGADCVMLGGMLAGTKEAPGEIVYIEEQAYKKYRGMGSIGAMKQGSADRYFQKQEQKKFIPEGVEGLVPFKGSVKDVLFHILGGLRSGMGYLGAKTLKELKKNTTFIKLSQAGRAESHVHNLYHVQRSPNY